MDKKMRVAVFHALVNAANVLLIAAANAINQFDAQLLLRVLLWRSCELTVLGESAAGGFCERHGWLLSSRVSVLVPHVCVSRLAPLLSRIVSQAFA